MPLKNKQNLIFSYKDAEVQHIKQDAFAIYNLIDQKTRALRGTDLLPPVFVTGGIMTVIRQMAEGIIKQLDDMEKEGKMIL